MTQPNSTYHEDLETGMWKFRDKVKPEELIEIAKKWSEEESKRYLDLHVRRCSKNQYGIGFQYIRKEDETPKQFFERISDFLRRNFGNDFVGWDISHETWVIK